MAQVVLSGIDGVQSAYTTAQKSPITIGFPAYPFVQAGLAGAFALAQLAKIKSTDVTGATPPTLGQGGAGGRPSAPSFNIVEGTEGSQILDSLNSQDKVTQAYVVSGDVSTAQSLDRNIVANSSL